jgi:hypothetical protein
MPSTPEPLILYSTNTWLAYHICELFYGQEHYVWCTPAFDPRSVAAYASTVPPTSSPSEVYHSLLQEVVRGDLHSTKIEENRRGILRGADFKRTAGVITQEEQDEIAAVVAAAVARDFRPLLYVIPYSQVASIVKKVAVNQRAHPLSSEYIIERLPRGAFDIIQLERGA